MCVLCASFAPMLAAAESLSDSLVLTVDKGEIKDNRVEIVATLTKNSGATGLILTLTYDNNALKLVEVTQGSALSQLSCTRTPTYSSPYKILYLKDGDFYQNDKSTGVLLKFVFEIKDNSRDGSYRVSLKADKNAVQYAENNQIKSKNLVSNSTTITVKGKQTTVEQLPADDVFDGNEPNGGDTGLWEILIPVVVAGVLLITFMVILVLKRGKVTKK